MLLLFCCVKILRQHFRIFPLRFPSFSAVPDFFVDNLRFPFLIIEFFSQKIFPSCRISLKPSQGEEDSFGKWKISVIKYAYIRHVPILLVEKEKKIVNSEERKDRKCFGDVRSVVTAKGERGGSEKKGKNLNFHPSLYLSRLGEGQLSSYPSNQRKTK